MTRDARDPSRTRAFGNRVNDIRVDWFRLIDQLRTKGYSLYAVSHFTGIPKSTLNGYKAGSQPSYHHGVCLVQFWAQTMEKDPTEAPQVSRFSHLA